jgi:hypothetical protein
VKRLALLAVTAVALVVLASPATGENGTARKLARISKRVDHLDRRLDAAALLLIGKDVEVEQLSTIGTVDQATRTASATVTCRPGYDPIGGGGGFNDPRTGDVLLYSKPSGLGWEAASRRPEGVTSGLFVVYVICLDQR